MANLRETLHQIELSAGGPGSGRHASGVKAPKARFRGNKQAVKEAHKELVSKGFNYKRTDSASEGRAANHKYTHDNGKTASIYEHNAGSVNIHK